MREPSPISKITTEKKLLVFTSTFPRRKDDNAGLFIYELSKRLTENFDVSILTPNCPGVKADEILDGMKVHRFRYFPKRYERLTGGSGILPTLKRNKWYYLEVPFLMAAGFLSLRKLVKQNRPDIIHAHWIPQGLLAALIKKLYGVPFIVTAHGSDVFGMRGKLLTSLKRFALKNADKITVVSNAIKQEIVTSLEPNLIINVISMGVDSKRFSPDQRDEKIREKYAIEGPFLLFVGRLIPEKGVKYLLEAMPDIIKEFPKAKLLIVGKGTAEKELTDLTKLLGLEENIIFAGELQNHLLPPYYATADVFVGPSVVEQGRATEGLGLTFVEAALSGCIPVGTKIGGIPDVITDGVNGFLVEQRNHTEISDKVIRLLKDESLIVGMKKQARTKIIGKFDWQIISAQYKEVLKDAAAT